VCVRVCVQLDYGQLKLVFDALHERLHMLRAAPHLTSAVPIMMPCYKLWEARTRTHSATASKVAPTALRAADARARAPSMWLVLRSAGALLLGGAEGV
jgi:glycerol-3-phosphate dehydrogenase